MLSMDEIFARIGRLSYRWAWVVLGVTAIITALAAWSGSTLSINADLSSLLPETAPSVVALRQAEREVGTRSSITVFAQGADDESLKAFAQATKQELEKIEDMGEVQFKKPIEFFEEHALYYMEVDQLERLQAQLKARKKYEVRKRNPLFVSLGKPKPAPKIDMDEVFGKDAQGQDNSASKQWLDEQLKNPYYMDNGAILLVAKPKAPSLDLKASQRLVHQARDVLAKIDLQSYSPTLTARLGGSHTKRVEQQEQISKDLSLASLVAMLLIVLYLGSYFRSVGAIALVLIPLGTGIVWTYGFAAIAFGVLNILTAFVSVILLGLGIDHGVHLLSRFGEQMQEQSSPEEALARAFAHTGRGVFIAAITTMVGFGALSLSNFRVFEEFGVLASVGVLSITMMYLVVLPSLIAVAVKLGWRPKQHQSELTRPLFDFIMRRPKWVVGFGATLVLGLMFALPQLSFQYNSRRMAGNLPSFEVDRQSDDLLGRSQSPMMVLTKSPEHNVQVIKLLQDRKAKAGKDSSIHFISSAADLVPTKQTDKAPLVEEIHDIIQDVNLDDVDAKDRPLIDALLRQKRAPEPFEFSQLPESIKLEFMGHGGSMHERLLFIYSQVDLSDGRKALIFDQEVADLSVQDATGRSSYYAVGAPLILADVLNYVFVETPKIIFWVMILMFFALLSTLRNLKATVIAQTTAVITLLTSGALMGLLGVQFNYINIIIIAVAFGMSVDGAVHMINDAIARRGVSTQSVYHIGRANAGALITTGLGFGAMKLANNPGVTSLADAALIALVVNIALTVLVLPAFLKLIRFGQPSGAT